MHAGIPTPPDQADPPGADTTPPPEQTPHTPPDQADPPRADTPQQADPPDQADPPQSRQTPPGSRLQHTVYERPVCILMHSCLQKFSIWWNDLMKVFLQIQVGRSTFTHTNSHLPVILEHRLHF